MDKTCLILKVQLGGQLIAGRSAFTGTRIEVYMEAFKATRTVARSTQGVPSEITSASADFQRAETTIEGYGKGDAY